MAKHFKKRVLQKCLQIIFYTYVPLKHSNFIWKHDKRFTYSLQYSKVLSSIFLLKTVICGSPVKFQTTDDSSGKIWWTVYFKAFTFLKKQNLPVSILKCCSWQASCGDRHIKAAVSSTFAITIFSQSSWIGGRVDKTSQVNTLQRQCTENSKQISPEMSLDKMLKFCLWAFRYKLFLLGRVTHAHELILKVLSSEMDPA